MPSTLTVQNYVVHANLGKELNLIQLGAELPEARYHTGEHPAVRLHVDEPRSDALIFANGKLVCSGTKTLEEARAAITQVKKMVKGVDKGIDGRAGSKVESVMASMEIGSTIDLAQLATDLGSKGVEYFPQTFEGLVYRTSKPRATLIIFESGVLVVTDVANENVAQRVARRFLEFMVKAEIIAEAPAVAEGKQEPEPEPEKRTQTKKDARTKAAKGKGKGKNKSPPKGQAKSKARAKAKK